jgi:uncharacterized protein YoxC
MAAKEDGSETAKDLENDPAADRPQQSGGIPSQRRKPQPITIDLEASSVRIEHPPQSEPNAAAADSAIPVTEEQIAAVTEATAASAKPAPVPEPQAAVNTENHPDPTRTTATEAKPELSPKQKATEATDCGNWSQLIAASLVGGAIGLIAAYGIAGFGLWPGQGNAAITAQMAALDARLAQTESKVGPTGELSVELQHLKSIPSIPGVTIADVEKILDPFTAKTAAAVAHIDDIDRKIAGEQAIVRGEGKALQESLSTKMSALENTVTGSAAQTGQIVARQDKLQQDLTSFDKKATDQLTAARSDLNSTIQALAARMTDLDTRTAAELAVVRGSAQAVAERVTAAEKALADLGTDTAALRKSLGSDADTIAKLQTQLQPLDDMKKAIDGLGGRIGAVDDVKKILEQQTSKLNTADDAKKAADGVAASLWIIDQRMANVQARLTDIDALKAAVAGGAKDMASLGARLAPVEAKLAGLDGYAKQGLDARKDAVAAVAIANLKSAADSGLPFGNELAAAKAVAGAVVDLTPLDGFAAKGLTPVTKLIDSFPNAARRITDAVTPAVDNNGLFGALLSHAAGSVKITPVNAQTGDTIAARLSRIDAKLTGHDLDGALAEWQALPEPARTASAEWGGLLTQHVAGTKAIATVSADLMAKLTSASQ